MLTKDQTLILYDYHRNLVTRSKLVDPLITPSNASRPHVTFTFIEWLLGDLLFCVYNSEGALAIFDIALNRLDLAYMTRFEMKFTSMGEYLSERIVKNNRFGPLKCSQTISHDSLWSCFGFAHGPIGLFRLALPNNFNCIALMTHYLKISQQSSLDGDESRYLRAAVKLMGALDWDRDGYEALTCLYKCMNFLLSKAYKNGTSRNF